MVQLAPFFINVGIKVELFRRTPSERYIKLDNYSNDIPHTYTAIS